MNKQAAIAKYSAAMKLNAYAKPAEWLAVFPTRTALAWFRLEVGQICWPENFGQSPWNFAFGVAYHVGEGFSPTSQEWYAKQVAAGCPYCTAEVAAVELYKSLAS